MSLSTCMGLLGFPLYTASISLMTSLSITSLFYRLIYKTDSKPLPFRCRELRPMRPRLSPSAVLRLWCPVSHWGNFPQADTAV